MSGKKILVVDDDTDLLKMLELRIKAEGYEFISARDGSEMLNILNMKKPDLVLLDVMLPNMDGYTALREMREQEEFKDTPVIILTAKEEKKIGDLFAFEKISFFVEKPFESSDLLKKIRSLL